MNDNSFFSQLLQLPPATQAYWLAWRNHRLTVTAQEEIIERAACPLKRCKAIEGQACSPRYHKSRHNEYFARLFMEEIA